MFKFCLLSLQKAASVRSNGVLSLINRNRFKSRKDGTSSKQSTPLEFYILFSFHFIPSLILPLILYHCLNMEAYCNPAKSFLQPFSHGDQVRASAEVKSVQICVKSDKSMTQRQDARDKCLYYMYCNKEQCGCGS